MAHSGFTIELKLAYAPLSNFDFTHIKQEPIIQQVLNGSMLYIIGQRPIMTFDDINFIEKEKSLVFDIKIKGKDNLLRCKLPLFQKITESNNSQALNVIVGSHDLSWSYKELPVSGANGIQIFDDDMKFLLSLSPDKLLHLFSHNLINVEIEGDTRPFNTYLVHYVGKATDQEIWKRLTGHSTLQEILSVENPFNYGSLPTHEIVLLLFRVSDLVSVRTMGDDVDIFVDNLLKKYLPTEKDVSLDAEKLLIKLLDPQYNDRKFPNYPKSSDGLFRFKFDRYIYHICENITLKYAERELYFDIDQLQSDLLGIKGNKEVEIIRHS